MTSEQIEGVVLDTTKVGLSTKQLEVLMKPLHRSRVKNRSQGGTQLSYLEAWDVKATLIQIFGFGGFDAEVMNVHIVDTREVPQQNNPERTNWKVSVMVTLRLKIHALECTYAETAVGTASLPDVGQAIDMATKSAESDALKRCCTYLGDQFGLSLYRDGSLANAVRINFAPGQEFDPRELSAETKQQAAESLGMTPAEQAAQIPDDDGMDGQYPVDSEDM